MSYQIHITDNDGTCFVVKTLDDLQQAEKRLAFMIEAARTPNIVMNSPDWRSIELYRVELISSTSVSSQEDRR